MSDTSQGPNWWQASDGRWYPPEQHPGYALPPPAPSWGQGPYGSSPWPGAGMPAATSGLAIASLVLSILWLGSGFAPRRHLWNRRALPDSIFIRTPARHRTGDCWTCDRRCRTPRLGSLVCGVGGWCPFVGPLCGGTGAISGPAISASLRRPGLCCGRVSLEPWYLAHQADSRADPGHDYQPCDDLQGHRQDGCGHIRRSPRRQGVSCGRQQLRVPGAAPLLRLRHLPSSHSGFRYSGRRPHWDGNRWSWL
jgi:hypothetical protein